jgi:glycosyltransferase involved in cell wall biosynthesis
MTHSKKITAFSMTPLFPDFAMGGGQKQLKKVALHLGELGHKLTILSTQREGSMTAFQWHDNVHINPILRFKQPYPEPYFTPLYHIANAMRDVGMALMDSDIHYSHDGGLIFPYVYQNIPTVISLRSILFAETLQSAFLFQGDEWILPSSHTRDSYEAVVSQFSPTVGERMHAIHNGFDWDKFQYTQPDAIFEMIPRSIANHPILLFPHRPEPPKGIYEVIQVARKLMYECGWSDLRVLVPRWLDADSEPSSRAYYETLGQAIHEAGLDDVFVFHDWINDTLIAEYYSLADATLCIGSYVETFGNTPFESLGCGTIPILSRVATYRDLLSEDHAPHVDYGDIDAVVALAHDILTENRKTSPETLSYLKSEFSLETMVTRYADVILNVQKKPTLSYAIPQLTTKTRYQLAPWCYLSEQYGIYHDFRADYQNDSALIDLIQANPDGFLGEMTHADRVHQWVDDGYIVPLNAERN